MLIRVRYVNNGADKPYWWLAADGHPRAEYTSDYTLDKEADEQRVVAEYASESNCGTAATCVGRCAGDVFYLASEIKTPRETPVPKRRHLRLWPEDDTPRPGEL